RVRDRWQVALLAFTDDQLQRVVLRSAWRGRDDGLYVVVLLAGDSLDGFDRFSCRDRAGRHRRTQGRPRVVESCGIAAATTTGRWRATSSSSRWASSRERNDAPQKEARPFHCSSLDALAELERLVGTDRAQHRRETGVEEFLHLRRGQLREPLSGIALSNMTMRIDEARPQRPL